MTYKLNCFVYPKQWAKPGFFELGDVNPGDRITDIRERLFARLGLNRLGITEVDLVPYVPKDFRTSDLDEDMLRHVENNYESNKGWKRLGAAAKLQGIFQQDELDMDLVHLVFVVQDTGAIIPSKRLRADDFEDSVHSEAEKAVGNAPNPSYAALPGVMRIQQNQFPIHNGVPYERTGQHVSIYSSALGALKDVIRNPNEEHLSADFLRNVHSFVYDALGLYESEDQRRKKMIAHLQDILGWYIHEKYGVEGAELDGAVLLNHGSEFTPLLCLQVKETLGSGVDAGYQSACGWRKLIVKNKMLFRKTCSPCVIVSIMGPYICISGAVFACEFIAESFTGYIFLGCGINMDERVIEIARIFRAISIALNQLGTEYRLSSLDTSNALMPRPGIIGNAPKLQYIRRFFEDEEHAAKAMFLAKLEEKDVLVKFTRRYNESAHRILASKKRAPALHFFGSIVGGLKMVVMEYIDGETLADLSSANRSLPISAYKDLRTALKLLHQEGIVHGDYRFQNLLVKDGRGYVVDFDWCGKDREAHYPPTLNDFDDIRWAEGVARGSLMMKEHDWHLFSKLRKDEGVDD